MRMGKANVPGIVDGLSNSCDIADMFAPKYQELYTSVPYDRVEMENIAMELNSGVGNHDK